MPTPVSIARQCLTEEAARALEDAVSVARRRSHAQTTSLHAVSALLALPSSTLREACARARSSAYSPRLQFRALELSVGVSLDRLPSSKTLEEPPVSNSLMAAIKRSQANQRRQPESFHLHQIIHQQQIQQQQQQQQQQTTSLFKVELKHLILSILDDPIVSRVFGEAGFRSSDIKFSIIHPPVSVSSSRLSKTRCPPIFLCNLTDSDLGQKGFSFPFMGGGSGGSGSGEDDGDENSRRIGTILVRKTGKNPLLIGVCANDALNCFAECVQKGKGSGVLPDDIDGLCSISIENEVSEFVANGGNKEKMDLKFKELGDMVKNCSGPGIVANFGDLKPLVDDGVSGDDLSYLVSRFTGLLEVYRDKLWLMGAAASYETYMKLLARFPSVEKDLDLHLLPITSSRPSIPELGSKSSLMGSFVPFGGFFSTTSDFKFSLSSNNESRTHCGLCNKKYEEEVSALKRGCNASISDQYSSTIPSWLQMTGVDPSKGVDAAKAKDEGAVLNAKIVGIQKKWDGICQSLHHTQPKPDISQGKAHILNAEGFQFAEDKENGSKDSSSSLSGSAILCPYMPTDLNSPQNINERLPVTSRAQDANFQFKLPLDVSKSQQFETGSPRSSLYHLPNLSLLPDRVPLPSVTSVTTDLGLGTIYASNSPEPKNPRFQDHEERLQNFSTSVSPKFNVGNENILNHIVKPSSCSEPDFKGKLDPRDFKSVWRVLLEKVGRQDEAICAISQTVSLFKSGKGKHHGSLRGDIWLSFLGPDKVAKKKIASALAEVVFGSRDSLISLDLSSQDGIDQSNSLFDSQELEGYDVKFRGKTVVDYIAEELRKRPHSVIFLENVDKADPLAQSSLSQAIRTGKFPDSYGREIGISNTIFVTTSIMTKGNQSIIPQKERVGFSEEAILEAKRWQMQILIRDAAGDSSRSSEKRLLVIPPKEIRSLTHLNKRKLCDTSDSRDCNVASGMPERDQKVSRSYLDLNLPLSEMEDENEYGSCDSGSISENSEAWLEDFFDQVNEKVVFKPFDFDSLADKVLKQIGFHFQKTIGSGILLEIDNLVMVQILAAAWLSDNKRAVEDWVEQVLGRSFAEAQQRYCPSARSMVKLAACEGLLMEKQAPGVCLPARIDIN